METILIALIAAIGAAYFVSKNPSITKSLSNAVSSGSTPKPLHLVVGANLLTDQQIAQMEADSINDRFGGNTAKKNSFINTIISYCLPNEIIADPTITKCGGSGNSSAPPLALTVGKEGQLVLSTATGIGSTLGGTFGSTAGFAGTGFAASGTALGSAIPIVGLIIGPALAILGAIAAHHKAAVGREQSLECGLVPPANQSLQIIEQAVTNGQISIAQGNQALNQLYSDFITHATGGAGGLKDSAGSLNAMGYYKHFLHAIIIKKQNRYASLTTS